MRAERPLRVPLQIGTSALSSLVLTAAYFVPGSILVGVPATVIIALDISDLGDAAGYIFFPGLFVCGMAWKYLLRARAQRPSDLLLTGDGFEIRGGPHTGRRIQWSEVTQVALEQPEKKQSKDEDDSDLRQLCVYGKRLGRLELASADRPSEQGSLKELARTLEAGRGAAPEYQKRTSAKEDATALLVCPACAAAVGPADAATVICPYCQATVPVGDDVRRRLRDAADVARRPDAAVAKLLDQPGAGFLSVLLSIGAVCMLTAWPIALVLAILNFFDNTLTLQGTGFLSLFVVACVVGFFGVLRGRLVNRQALRLVALDFGAIPPSAAGQPYLCRRCLAPLSAGAEQALVTCVYCQSDNILGIDLRRDAKVAREESQSLADALKRRISERRRWRGVSFLGAGLLVLSGYSLRNGIGHNERTWPLEQKCARADLSSCVALADLLSQKDSDPLSEKDPTVPTDHKRAAKLYARGCEGNIAHACARQADYVQQASWKESDRQRTKDLKVKAKELKARACELGDPASCTP